jgi:hypothetical protein
MKGTDLLDDAAIAELLAHEAEQASGQAFRGAARKAFLWEHETCDLLAAGKPLTELEGIDPFLARRIGEWFEKSPPRMSPPEIREEFLTLTRARRVLAEHPKIDVKSGCISVAKVATEVVTPPADSIRRNTASSLK